MLRDDSWCPISIEDVSGTVHWLRPQWIIRVSERNDQYRPQVGDTLKSRFTASILYGAPGHPLETITVIDEDQINLLREILRVDEFNKAA